MNRIIECVPNVSEGRNTGIIDMLTSTVQNTKGVALLDLHQDPDHNRSVLTYAGEPEALAHAAFDLAENVLAHIDMNSHGGVHPRIGALDVMPFIPLIGTTMRDCIELAKKVGARIGSELQIPVFLYEEACLIPQRRQLEIIRRGGLNGLASRMQSDQFWIPDYGPRQPHARVGACVVGARQLLIAYNVVLESNKLAIAQQIAEKIRSSGGGLPSLKAIGVDLQSRGLVQVSMNLTNHHETSISMAFEAIMRKAREHEVAIVESEIVGLVPKEALDSIDVSLLKLKTWNPDQVIETRLTQVGLL